jgi:hypothetical protein
MMMPTANPILVVLSRKVWLGTSAEIRYDRGAQPMQKPRLNRMMKVTRAVLTAVVGADEGQERPLEPDPPATVPKPAMTNRKHAWDAALAIINTRRPTRSLMDRFCRCE